VSQVHTPARLTYDDLVAMPDDGLRHEIIDGVHFVTPSPNLRHQELLGRLYLAIGLWLREHPGAGRVFFAPLDVLFSRYDVVEPDLLFVAADRQDVLTAANVQGAPSLVVEVLSPGTRTRDHGIKRDLFNRGGVREYWLVDPDAQSITVYARSSGERFGDPSILTAAATDVLMTPQLPDFRLALREYFAD
jgi:Uma2 family endonuclease